MTIAGSKTQLLVLSHWNQDAKNASTRVAGTDVPGSPHLKLLGVGIRPTAPLQPALRGAPEESQAPDR